jgi:hypothetical protein
LDLHLYEEFRFTALVFWWGTRKGMRPGRSGAPDCWDGKALELSYDNLEEERAQI